VLPCLGGGDDVDLRASAPGRPTLVNVWGDLVPPCVEEVPDLAAFAERAGDGWGWSACSRRTRSATGWSSPGSTACAGPSVVDDQGEVIRAFRPGPR
jgi:hypothetical protein